VGAADVGRAMTTATRQRIRLWDFLLGEDAPARPVVEMWRETNWRNIKIQLLSEFGAEVSDSREPHWVGPGTAVWYQNRINRLRVEKDGHYEFREEETGFLPTDPLPCNNASLIHRYLEKGLRLRPLEYDVDIEASETADSPNGSREPQQTFHCKRHPTGSYRFDKWGTYLHHCNHYRESIEEKPPGAIIERMGQFRWYCLRHDVGWRSQRAVRHHVGFYSDDQLGLRHATLVQMEVKKE
jgi:hypothetical protein